jgi:biotin operon repressor
MVYRRSHEIEQRLDTFAGLIGRGGHSTPSLARALQVSEPMVNCDLAALRERGFQIRSVKDGSGWS